MATKKMLLVTDENGRVIAAAHQGPPSGRGANIGIRPLPGQRVLEVEMPEELTRLTSGPDFGRVLADMQLEPTPARAQFKKTTTRRIAHKP